LQKSLFLSRTDRQPSNTKPAGDFVEGCVFKTKVEPLPLVSLALLGWDSVGLFTESRDYLNQFGVLNEKNPRLATKANFRVQDFAAEMVCKINDLLARPTIIQIESAICFLLKPEEGYL
jgi:hypothetical protein